MEVSGKSAVAGSRKPPTNTRQYLGALADGTSYDLKSRQYQPSIGQFLSPDPAANPGIGYQYGNANPMSQIDPFGMSASSWLNVVAAISAGAATTSATPNVNCTNGAWCSQLNTIAAPLAETGGAVSWTNSDLSAMPSSAKGSYSSTIINAALGGNASGGGLADVATHAHRPIDWNDIGAQTTAVAASLIIGAVVGIALAPLCVTVILCAVDVAVSGAVGGYLGDATASALFHTKRDPLMSAINGMFSPTP